MFHSQTGQQQNNRSYPLKQALQAPMIYEDLGHGAAGRSEYEQLNIKHSDWLAVLTLQQQNLNWTFHSTQLISHQDFRKLYLNTSCNCWANIAVALLDTGTSNQRRLTTVPRSTSHTHWPTALQTEATTGWLTSARWVIRSTKDQVGMRRQQRTNSLSW